MATINAPSDFSPSSVAQASGSIAKYISLGQYLNAVNMPDNRERLVSTYGDQSISGLYSFLYMAGAISAGGSADEVTWWEDTRLHAKVGGTSVNAADAGTKDAVTITLANPRVAVNNVVLIYGGASDKPQVAIVVSKTALNYVVRPNGTWNFAIVSGAVYKASVIGSSYGQGTIQPVDFNQPNIVKRTNTYGILKNTFAVTGSQMTNKSWVKIDGMDAFYHKGEQDFRKVTKDQVEMMHVFGDTFTNNDLSVTSLNITGYEGYIPALHSRGIVNRGFIEDRADLEAICEILDKEGGAVEYTGFVNTKQQFKIDALAAALNANLAYGTFSNSKDMALQLGYKSLGLGGREFHFQNWKLMNDPTLLGQQEYYKGVLVPNDSIKDSNTGIEAPLLEINYKNLEGYSREMETWVNGSANGIYNNSAGFDGLKWDIRCEQTLVTRAANRHVLLA